MDVDMRVLYGVNNDPILVEYKPQRRTVFVDSTAIRDGKVVCQYESYFVHFPYMLFLKYISGSTPFLYAVLSESGVESLNQEHKQIVYSAWLPNIYEKSRVCCWESYNIGTMINNFWSQPFNTDGACGCARLLGMWCKHLAVSRESFVIANSIAISGNGPSNRLSYIHQALSNWQKASYEEVIQNMRDGYPDVANEICGCVRGLGSPPFRDSWELKEWIQLVYGRNMKLCFGFDLSNTELLQSENIV
jgi:hypothetical protein